MPTVSIIIPVYNAERYLHQCISSVLEQQFTDFELLLINDGSTDNSAAICDSFKITDDRVTVFHQKNSGVSASRNLGLSRAKGKWITFIDSDDWISEDYFQILLKYPHEDWILLSTDRENGGNVTKALHFENAKYNKIGFLDQFTVYPHIPGPCGKFYQSEIIKKNRVRFNINLHFGEDALFNITYLKFADKIVTSEEPRYYYRNREGSLSSAECDFFTGKYLFECIKTELASLPEKYHTKNLVYIFGRMLNGLYSTELLQRSDKEIEIKNIIKNYGDLMMAMSPNRALRYLLTISRFLGNYSVISKLLISKSKNETLRNHSRL